MLREAAIAGRLKAYNRDLFPLEQGMALLIRVADQDESRV